MEPAQTGRDENERELRALMAGYQAGDRSAFERLHSVLAPSLRRYLVRLARDPDRADDLLQDTFLQLHRARHTYDPAYPVSPWACAVARHAFLMDCRYRRRRADLSRGEPLDDTTVARLPGHDDALVAKAEVQRALGRLSPGTRRSIVLHHLHGLSFEEVSRRLRVGEPALRARASRGMARLRRLLGAGREPHGRD